VARHGGALLVGGILALLLATAALETAAARRLRGAAAPR
jgi:hypothetical protein